MDINDARSLMTVLAFVSFLGIVFWAYSSRNKQRFEAAAQLPFDDDERRGASADGRERP